MPYLQEHPTSITKEQFIRLVERESGVKLDEQNRKWIEYSWGSITGEMYRRYYGDVGVKRFAKFVAKDIKWINKHRRD